MSTRQPTCAAVLINYNNSAYLPHALKAALNQTVPFDEIVVVDDASTDGSVGIIHEHIRDFPSARLVVNSKNVGIVSALNIGLQEARSDFVYYMSADDTYGRQIMEMWQPALERYPDVAMLSGNARVCNSETGSNRQFVIPFPQQIARYTSTDLEATAKKRALTFYGGANLIRRDVVLALGGQRVSLKWHADWFLYLLVACRYPFAVVPQEFIRIRQTSDQYSHACFHWETQKPVIREFIRILREEYPEEYPFFRRCGLLPTYDIEAIFLLLGDKSLRHYLTPLLAWRLLTYKPLRLGAKLLPEAWRANVRRLLRV